MGGPPAGLFRSLLIHAMRSAHATRSRWTPRRAPRHSLGCERLGVAREALEAAPRQHEPCRQRHVETEPEAEQVADPRPAARAPAKAAGRGVDRVNAGPDRA